MEGSSMRRWFLGFALAVWGASASAQSVQVLGDSILVWNSWSDASIVDHLEKGIEGPILNNAASGAMLTNPNVLGLLFGYDIRSQYEAGPWDWFVIDGGGNDLFAECGCGLCDAVLDDLSAPDGREGAMPALINEIRDTGAQVVLMGYYLTPTSGNDWFGCADELTELNARYLTIAERDVDVYFLDAAALIPASDASLFDDDLLHPSEKGSRILADAIAQLIQAN